MINKLIIFGSNGMLGGYLKKYFSNRNDIELLCITRKEFNVSLENISNLENFLLNMKINNNTCIINCIGLIPQRNITNNITEYYVINTIFPLYLSKICNKYGTELIIPTTDCVFKGEKGDYIETDFHDETNSYGISKSLGETLQATIIRVSIIGEELYNKKSFLEFVKNSTEIINGWSNHLWNGITCLQYCKIIEKIIIDNIFWKGIRHIYSPTKKSKYELANIIKNTYNLEILINKVDTDVIIDKSLNSIYEINSIFNIPSLEQQIYEQSKFSLHP